MSSNTTILDLKFVWWWPCCSQGNKHENNGSAGKMFWKDEPLKNFIKNYDLFHYKYFTGIVAGPVIPSLIFSLHISSFQPKLFLYHIYINIHVYIHIRSFIQGQSGILIEEFFWRLKVYLYSDFSVSNSWLRLESSDCLLVDWDSRPIGNRKFIVTVLSCAQKKSQCIHYIHYMDFFFGQIFSKNKRLNKSMQLLVTYTSMHKPSLVSFLVY